MFPLIAFIFFPGLLLVVLAILFFLVFRLVVDFGCNLIAFEDFAVVALDFVILFRSGAGRLLRFNRFFPVTTLLRCVFFLTCLVAIFLCNLVALDVVALGCVI